MITASFNTRKIVPQCMTLPSKVFHVMLFVLCACPSFAQIPDSLIIPYHYINSFPQNAAIYLNDSLLGFTPLRLFAPAVHGLNGCLSIRKNGYRDYLLRFPAGDSLINKTFYLLSLNHRRENLVKQDESGFFKKQRKTIPIIAGGALTLGASVSAYYFKTLANEKYSEYLRTGFRTLLAQTKRYDLYSGISLAVLQLGMVALIYFLFID